MSTLGYGTVYPNAAPTEYASTGDLSLHPIAIWHGWSSIIYQGVVILGLLFNTVAEVWLEWQEKKTLSLVEEEDHTQQQQRGGGGGVRD